MTDPSAPAFIYLFDPLCGWCYGAAPAIRWLHAQPGVNLQVCPVGLFAWRRAQPLAPMRSHIRAADSRIAALTGQPFSDAYFTQVVDADATLDSGPATLALFTAERQRAGAALDLLGALQTARWVEGRDVGDPAVLQTLALGLDLMPVPAEDDAALHAGLLAGAQRWAEDGAGLLSRIGARGVPTLLRQQGDRLQPVPSDYLYQHRDRLAELLAA